MAPLDSYGGSGAGVQALSESYLYTVEALDDCYERLAPGAWLALTRWDKQPPRDGLKLFAMAIEMLRAGSRAWQSARPDSRLADEYAPHRAAPAVRRRHRAAARILRRARLRSGWFPGIRVNHFGVVSETVAQGERQGEHPLPDGNLGKDAVHQVRGGVGHAAPATGRTHGSALARKGQQFIAAAGLAPESQEAAGQLAAVEEFPQCALDELRDGPAALLLAGKKRLQVSGDNTVEHGLFRMAWTVCVR